MADMRDRLIDKIMECDKDNDVLNCFRERPRRRQAAEIIADYLLANGEQMSKSSCPYCCANSEGHGRLASSYDDEDGMKMSIHPSAKRANGYQSQAWWATVHFRGECRDFYIEVCPFCGRRLVPLKEEYESCCP